MGQGGKLEPRSYFGCNEGMHRHREVRDVGEWGDWEQKTIKDYGKALVEK